MDNLIAKSVVRSVSPIGDQVISTFGVGTPVKQPTVEYGCAVLLPADSQPKMIFGEDSLQALSLAMRFSADRIHDLILKGWKFFYPESDERFPFEAYFVHFDGFSQREGLGCQAENDTECNR